MASNGGRRKSRGKTVPKLPRACLVQTQEVAWVGHSYSLEDFVAQVNSWGDFQHGRYWKGALRIDPGCVPVWNVNHVRFYAAECSDEMQLRYMRGDGRNVQRTITPYGFLGDRTLQDQLTWRERVGKLRTESALAVERSLRRQALEGWQLEVDCCEEALAWPWEPTVAVLVPVGEKTPAGAIYIETTEDADRTLADLLLSDPHAYLVQPHTREEDCPTWHVYALPGSTLERAKAYYESGSLDALLDRFVTARSVTSQIRKW